jgi:hypothetical protein
MRIVLGLLLFATCTIAQVASMTGNWQVDAAASDFGALEMEHDIVLNIEPVSAGSGIQLRYDTVEPGPSDILVVHLDGYEHPTGRANESAAARQLGAAVLVVYERNVLGSTFVHFEMWKLSADGSILTRFRQRRDGAPNGESKLVFRRIPAR